MADRITRFTRNIQIDSLLPNDVLPNIMLRVEDRQDFARLACTCHGFYAWSEPWLKSRRQAAELNRDPQRLIKVPAWIKTNSRHLHPADWDALQLSDIANENWKRRHRFMRGFEFEIAARLQPGPAPSATKYNAAHLDFILFSPRLLADVNEEVAKRVNERLAANAYFVLAGFHPRGEAWQYDVLAGAVAWLKKYAATISFKACSRLMSQLSNAMNSLMLFQRSPALAVHLLEHKLSKSHFVSSCGSSNERWEDPLLTALILTARNSTLEAGSSEATSFLCAIHQVISNLAQLKESAALSLLIDHLTDVMKLMSEDTWIPGSAQSAWLYALVQAVRDMPVMLADIRNTLIERGFITQDMWDALLQLEPVVDPEQVEVSVHDFAQ